MKVESLLYEKIGSKVKCNTCSRYCIIDNNKHGFCNIRKNINETLYSFNSISGVNVDHIEKKPLYHFFPSSLSYSVGSFSCNFACLNCQNYTIAKEFHGLNDKVNISPERVVENAINSECRSIAWTYNEPTMHLEYMLETSYIACKNNLKNVFISNGYMSDESLDLLLPVVDAFNIDLKAMSQEFYKNVANAELEPVLNNLKKIYNNKIHLEITNLLISGLNTSDKSIEDLVNFVISNLGDDVPLHFSRFYPCYKMENRKATSIEDMVNAQEIAINLGMKHVYLGNVNTDQNSYCPNCGELLFQRSNYHTISKIKNNKCLSCGEKLNFVL